MKRLAFVLILLPALSWAQKPTVIISGDGAATVVSVGTQGPAGANIPAGGSEGQGACKSGAGLGWCSTFLCTGGNCSFSVPILAGDGAGIGFAGEPTTKFWRNLAGAIDVDFSGISGMRFQSGVLRLLTATGTIYAGYASDTQIGRDAASTWQLGPDATQAMPQILKGPDSTGPNNPGGELRLIGGSPGAGETQSDVIIGADAYLAVAVDAVSAVSPDNETSVTTANDLIQIHSTSGTGAPQAQIQVTPGSLLFKSGDGVDSEATWILVPEGLRANNSIGTQPTCSSSTRGIIWYKQGGAGVSDMFEFCRKDAANVYAWVSLF